jgi:hypothetical protein
MDSQNHVAEVKVPDGGGQGTLIAQGGRFGGWSLYIKDGVPAYDYNYLGLERTTISASEALDPGSTTIRFEFAYDGDGPGKGALAPFTSMMKRSRKSASNGPSRGDSQRTRPPMWVSISPHRLSKRLGPSVRPGSTAGFRS